MDYEQQYENYQLMLEQALERALPIGGLPWKAGEVPESLAKAMRYSLLAPGKRLRPVLLLASYQLMEGDPAPALPFAVALEMIHCYSLIHDDLPAMDDDSFRRGMPTNHRVFGEAMAILAGDALLNEAFEQMLSSGHPRALGAMKEIAFRSGARGMIAGQVADLHMEGKAPEASMLHYIHQHKTAALITAAVCAGLHLGGADAPRMALGRDYGQALGLCFQIVDDLLDVEGEQDKLGKSTGKDAAQGKLTWPALHGLEAARAEAVAQAEIAMQAALKLEGGKGFLHELAHRSLRRVN